MDDLDITDNDRLIWSINHGDLLTATKDLLMRETGERSFTAGKTYRVKSMHPLAETPYVILINDQGEDHRMEGRHVRWFFGGNYEVTGVPASSARPVDCVVGRQKVSENE